MSRFALLLLVIGAALAAWILGARISPSPRDSWRYKMTVEVETPNGVRTGSAVREVRFRPAGHAFIAEGRDNWSLRGQAVAVDLPGGRTLYALLRSGERCFGYVDYGARIADLALGGRGGRITGLPGPVELIPGRPDREVFTVMNPVPTLVTFSDPLDSRSVQMVHPNNLEGTFGPGYALRRITIDVVSRPLTDDIKARLPWLIEIQHRSLDPGFVVTANPTIAQCLTGRDFVQG